MSALVRNTLVYGALRIMTTFNKKLCKDIMFLSSVPLQSCTTTWLIMSALSYVRLDSDICTTWLETPLTESHVWPGATPVECFIYDHCSTIKMLLTAFICYDILCMSELRLLLMQAGHVSTLQLGCTPPAVGRMQRGEDCSVHPW